MGDALREARAAAARDGRSASAKVSQLESDNRLLADAMLRLARHGNLTGADAVRNALGRETALAVVRMAQGQAAAGRLAEGWAEQERERASGQVSSRLPGGGYEDSPEHDPRVTAAILAGVPDAGLQRVLREVREEYAGQAREKLRAQQRQSLMWETASGQQLHDGMPVSLGVAYGAGGAPQQRSYERKRWEDYPDHQPAQRPPAPAAAPPVPAPPTAPAAVALAEVVAEQAACEHPGLAEHREWNFCDRCGAPAPEPREAS